MIEQLMLYFLGQGIILGASFGFIGLVTGYAINLLKDFGGVR